MNREIRFRAWDKETNEMYYFEDGDWLYYRNGKWSVCWEEDLSAGIHSGCLKDFILMQFTGLKDKNGLEIDWWENDLLQSLGTNKKIGQIKYDEKCAEWRLYVDGNSWCSLVAAYYDGWKKVGNIHQNPKLLEQENAR